MKLEGKSAVVTGASSGMGREIARQFAQEGAKVFAVARRIDRLLELVEEAKAYPGSITAFAADIADQENVEAMLAQAVREFGRVNILVNNAGIMDDMSGVGDASDEMLEKVFDLNFRAPFFAMRKIIPHFKEQGGGVIINTSSLSGLYGCRAGVAYTASKHAVVGLTQNTAFMYANDNIRCNAICPGAVETEIASGEFMKQINQAGAARCSAGLALNPRTGKAVEIARVAVFLASEDASFVNGQCIVVDGGWTSY